MLPLEHPDRIQISFDDHRLVNNAGLILPATLARHLGLPQLVRQRLDLGDVPGQVNTGDKIVTTQPRALAAGAQHIGVVDAVAASQRHRLRGKAPSTLGTFLRSFRRGTSVSWIG